ncbi:MAG: exodeoxyribonuclease VII large subunit, partial [Acidobacteria bacterium]|nr:exodeoxyribonuclease VII large subunit [Acidobacteriota bacterium]
AIQQLNLWSAEQGEGEALDLILLTRGGGRLEDLWAFNEEVLARAVHQSELPVVSAVGHEIDFLITDFVSDVRASTPSVAAELITQDVFASRRFLVEAAAQLSRLAKRRVGLNKRDLLTLSHRLNRAHPRRALDDAYQRLDNQYDDLNRLTRHGLAIRRDSLRLARQRLASLRPAALVAQRGEQLTWLRHRLGDVPRRKLGDHCARFGRALSRLELLSPKAVLARGYSITCDAKTGAVLRDARKAKIGQVLRTQLHAGDVSSTINAPKTSR